MRIDGAVAPDHWLDPSVVWEVKCADLSLSPIYPAARGLVSAGVWENSRREGRTDGEGLWVMLFLCVD